MEFTSPPHWESMNSLLVIALLIFLSSQLGLSNEGTRRSSVGFRSCFVLWPPSSSMRGRAKTLSCSVRRCAHCSRSSFCSCRRRSACLRLISSKAALTSETLNRGSRAAILCFSSSPCFAYSLFRSRRSFRPRTVRDSMDSGVSSFVRKGQAIGRSRARLTASSSTFFCSLSVLRASLRFLSAATWMRSSNDGPVDSRMTAFIFE
mmetsp:Transcript_14410/g.36880  ORF Transcript_14410/g.36880 Transcript_14410/m.36880 type:complete len:205 (+) Transcript_14410:304-918(+)